MDVPSEADFLADTRGGVTADLGRHCVVWQEMFAEILNFSVLCKDARNRCTHRLVPVDGNTSAVDVGRRFVFEILEARIARLLRIACLETEVKEATNAVLSSCRRVVKNEAEADDVLA